MAINTKRSFTEYVVSTAQSEFAIGFDDYNKPIDEGTDTPRDIITVTIDDKDPTTAGYTVTRISPEIIKFDPDVPANTPPHIVRLQRETNIDKSFHVFSNGAKWNAQSIDENFEQVMHSQQESRDGYIKLRDDVIPLVDGLEDALKTAEEAAKAAKEAADAAEEAAKLSRSTDNVYYTDSYTQSAFNDGINSIADLPNKDLRTGLRIYVKSYLAGKSKGGGWFIYDASKASLNDRVIHFNGWVRQVTDKLYLADGGCNDDISVDNVAKVNKVIEVASTYHVPTVVVDAVYMLGSTEKGITTTPFGDENAWWMIKARSNVKLIGSRDVGFFIKAGMASSNVGEPNTKGYMVIGDYNQSNVVNFHVEGFTIDNNGVNNLAPPAVGFSQPLCPNIWFQRGTNITVSNVHFKDATGHQTVVFDGGVTVGSIDNNLFTNNGKGFPNNVECVDHSSIYCRATNVNIHHNILTFSSVRPDVSTALEIHGVNCNVHSNIIVGYPYPLIRAAFFGQSSTGVQVYSNTAIDCVYGVNLDGADNSPLDANVYNNIFLFRSSKPFDGRANVAVGHTTGGFTGVTPSSTHRIAVNIKRNTFVQPTPIGWSQYNEFDNTLFDGGKCTDVLFEGNTFTGFRSGYRINYNNSKATYDFKDTLINCGSTTAAFNSVMFLQNVDAAYTSRIKRIELNSRLIDTVYNEQVYFGNSLIPAYIHVLGSSTSWILPYTGESPAAGVLARFDYSVDTIEPSKILYAQGYAVVGKITYLHNQYLWKDYGYEGRWNMHRTMPVAPTTPRFFGDVHGDTVDILKPNAGGYRSYICTTSSPDPSTTGTWKGYSPIQN